MDPRGKEKDNEKSLQNYSCPICSGLFVRVWIETRDEGNPHMYPLRNPQVCPFCGNPIEEFKG